MNGLSCRPGPGPRHPQMYTWMAVYVSPFDDAYVMYSAHRKRE